jgi:hypothetical protein
MTPRGTLVLVVILAALTGYLWLAEVRPRAGIVAPAPGGHAREELPLLAVPPGRVARVELEQGETLLTALRRDGEWADARGRPWRANVVSDLVETLGALRPVMVVDPDPERPADYGLGPEASRLRLVGADGEELLVLEVGERNPAWTGLYARRAGRREVMLVGAVLRWELEKLRSASPPP